MTKRPRVFFRGPEERLPLIGHLQNSFTKEVSNIKFEEEVIIEIDQDDDDDDDDIEVLEVVTHDQKIYKPIKKEDMTPHGAKSDPKDKPLIHSTGQLITVRFRKQFRQHRNELRYKDSLVPVHLLKGNINKPRFQKVKRTIENEEEEDQENEIECKKVKTNNFAVPTSLNTVLPKSVQNVQVQVSNLPKEWLESGTKRISSIAEAYGPPDEEVLESVNLLQDKSVVIVFKKDIFAYAFYESLHQREVYETMISVTEPSAECSIYSQTSVTN